MSPRRSFGGERKRQEARHRQLLRGGAMEYPCKLRRTSARGWGPWTDATLVLGAVPDGEVRWQVADPIAVGFPITRGAIDLPFTEVTEVWLRSVRFQTEAFWGMDAEIVVVGSERTTIELAVPPADAEALADRLDQLRFGSPGASGGRG